MHSTSPDRVYLSLIKAEATAPQALPSFCPTFKLSFLEIRDLAHVLRAFRVCINSSRSHTKWEHVSNQNAPDETVPFKNTDITLGTSRYLARCYRHLGLQPALLQRTCRLLLPSLFQAPGLQSGCMNPVWSKNSHWGAAKKYTRSSGQDVLCQICYMNYPNTVSTWQPRWYLTSNSPNFAI